MTDLTTEFSIIFTTTPDQTAAETLAKVLLTEGLAACVQLMPLQSFYHWQGNIEQSAEIGLWIKSRTANFAAVAACITANHRYEVPEIIEMPLTAIAAPYQAWLQDTLQQNS